MTSKNKAEIIVREFLGAMEARDLEKAKSFLRSDFSMVFPGTAVFTELSDLVSWSKERYQSIAKTYERFDTCTDEEGAIVYCFGTLRGVWLNGDEFSGIRFIDRFGVHDGLIFDQRVWNDLEIYRRGGT